LDIPEMKHVIHYHLPAKEDEFTHRNGRTARMLATGTAYVKVDMVPTSRRPAVRGLNPQQRYDGLYSILICTPENLGPGAGYDIADLLLDRFDATTDISLSGLTISIDYSEVRTSFLDSPFYCTPVTIAWYVYN
jgi:hypothetical protein